MVDAPAPRLGDVAGALEAAVGKQAPHRLDVGGEDLGGDGLVCGVHGCAV